MKNRAKWELGDRELDLMQVLWRMGKATVSQVQEVLRDWGHEVAYTTIQTMLNRLVTKNYVARDESGRTHLYYALLEEPSAADNAVKRLVERFFGGSVEGLMSQLVEKDLTAEQLERIQSLISAHKREKKR
jgi:BlaI family transcriptional regulator, penicillinase repressor